MQVNGVERNDVHEERGTEGKRQVREERKGKNEGSENRGVGKRGTETLEGGT